MQCMLVLPFPPCFYPRAQMSILTFVVLHYVIEVCFADLFSYGCKEKFGACDPTSPLGVPLI